jgi:photosystem II stability/assembly factor-like uncharacterized protein
MKKFLLVTLVSLVQLVNAQWSYLGLGGTQVSDLTIHYDTIYASTYDGIYKKNVLSADTAWLACGMQGNHVVQTLVPDNQTFICVVEIGSSRTTQIFKSTNGGDTFSLMNISVSNSTSYQFLDHIAHPEGDYDTLYFLHHQLKTFDGGTTWDSIHTPDNINRFIKVNPEKHSQLFIGGETLFFGPFLQTSLDYGDNWTSVPDMSSFFAGDNAVHDMAFNGNDWFAVGEGVIGKTSDGGNKWDQLLNTWSYPPQWGLYIFDIEFSPVDTNKLYATGDGFEVYKVPLLYSADYGITWDTLSYNGVTKPDIHSLTVKNTVSGDKVFLGGTGVYVYYNNFTGIEDDHPVKPNSFHLSDNYPNPFNPVTNISFTVGMYNYTSLRIYDLLGREVATLVSENLPAGNYTMQWNAAGLPSGVYFYRLQAGIFAETKKLLLLK